MDMDITHTVITIPIVTPTTGRIGTMDTITGLIIGTAATASTITLGTTTIAGKRSTGAVKIVQIGAAVVRVDQPVRYFFGDSPDFVAGALLGWSIWNSFFSS